MTQPSVVIIGGGLAGLSAGCYTRASGFHTQIVEQGALGGVCTAWQRGPYVVDGCIQWLTGGPFSRVYEELGILDQVPLRTIRHFTRLQHAATDVVVDVTADLDALRARLTSYFPTDAGEIGRIIDGARQIADLSPMVERAPELLTWRDGLKYLWQARHELAAATHFRKPLGEYAADHLSNPELRQLLMSIAPPEAPALFLLLMLGYLERGWLSRPVGGSAAFRDALIRTYGRLRGETRIGATVEEILVNDDRACGVRLADGSWIEADAVISTSSAPETVFHLLGGRYDTMATDERMHTWTLFPPIVLAMDVATPLTYWATARSWRGAYEGWMPSGGSLLASSLPHRLPSLAGMYLAGQWVEPGGGVPLACTSGRKAVQVLCADRGVPFVIPPRVAHAA